MKILINIFNGKINIQEMMGFIFSINRVKNKNKKN
jgi:hypothetical protein